MVKADGPFCVYGVNSDGSVTSILGPERSDGRSLDAKYRNKEPGTLLVKAEKSVMWSFDLVDNGSKHDPDQTPIAVDVGDYSESMEDMVRRVISTELSRHAERGGAETFEEANDFDVEDGEMDDMLSPYETYELREERPDPPAKKEPAAVEPQPEEPAEGSEHDSEGE